MQPNHTSDPRAQKAIDIALGASQWFKCRVADGSKRFGIPSSRDPLRYHLADTRTCTCADAEFHPATECKHVRAVQLYCASIRAGVSIEEFVSRPASDVVEGLTQMVETRRPVLNMVRHEDGEISWERAKPKSADEEARLAQRYTEIFGRL